MIALRFTVTELGGRIFLKDRLEVIRYEELQGDQAKSSIVEIGIIRTQFKHAADHLTKLQLSDVGLLSERLIQITLGEDTEVGKIGRPAALLDSENPLTRHINAIKKSQSN
jgi:hypothetical protein